MLPDKSDMMSEREPSTYRPLVFSVIEDDGENVTIEISEEDYQADLEAGIDEEDTMVMYQRGLSESHRRLDTALNSRSNSPI